MNRLLLQEVEAMATEAPAIRHQHAVPATRRNGDIGRDDIGFVQNVRFVAGKDAGHRLKIGELGPPAVMLGR